jgi:hypothetical protein
MNARPPRRLSGAHDPARRRLLQAGVVAAGGSMFPLGLFAQGAQSAGSLAALPRRALVIGNDRYRDAPLKNPVNDARAIRAELEAVDFSVSTALDATLEQMRERIEAYGRELARDKAVGLFYFAGHGIQLSWRNYLLPVDTVIDKLEEVRDKAFDLGRLLELIGKAGNPANIVILDACRNNPFGRDFRVEQKGLSQVDAPVGTLLAYATAPGNVAIDGEGDNGLYTENLLREIRVPDAKVEDIFKRVRLSVRRSSKGLQIPWESTSLEDDFYFQLPEEMRKVAEAARQQRLEAEREARRKEDEAKRRIEEERQARLRAETERRRLLEEELRQKQIAEAEQKKRLEEELRQRQLAEAEQRRRLEEELRRKRVAEAERQRLLAEDARRQELAEAERRKKLQEAQEAARLAEVERQKKLEEAREAARRAEDEIRRKEAEQLAVLRRADEERHRQEEEARARQRVADAERRRKLEAERAAREQDEDAKRRRYEAQLAQWERIESNNDPRVFEEFLRSYPSGSFAELAQLRLDQLLARQGEQRVEIVNSSANPYTKGTARANTAFKVGDLYRFRVLDLYTKLETRRQMQRITEITDNEVVYNDGRLATDLLGNITRNPQGRRIFGVQHYPLEYAVGRKWTTRYRTVDAGGKEGDAELDYKVVARESVSVPAGTFDCYKVEGEGGIHGVPVRLRFTHWMAPDKCRRPIVSEQFRQRGANRVMQSDRIELVEFRES